MKIITGKEILGLGRALADFDKLNARLERLCNTRYVCPAGHETAGADLVLDQRSCATCGGLLRKQFCPFYGYHAIPDMRLLAGSRGNQCAMVLDAFSPCRMEVHDGKKPDWETCAHWNKPESGSLAASLLVFDKWEMGGPAMDVAASITALEECYRMGFDCGAHGPDVTNCHFRFFCDAEHTAEWERGKADAVKGGAREEGSNNMVLD
jgi:hypothetical protein